MAHDTTMTARRADVEVFGDARLALDRAGVPGTVQLHVCQGVATLTGTVRRASDLTDAADAIRFVAGVTRIVNELHAVRTVSAAAVETRDGGKQEGASNVLSREHVPRGRVQNGVGRLRRIETMSSPPLSHTLHPRSRCGCS